MLKGYIQDTAARTEVNAVIKYNTEVQEVSKVGKNWAVRTATLQTRNDGSQSRITATTASVPEMLNVLSSDFACRTLIP